MDRTEGCLGVLIMGLDGIAVEKVWQGEATGKNLDVAVAEYTSLIRNAKQKNSDTGLGELRELTVTSRNGIFILRLLSNDYYLALIMSPDGNFGRGRYELRRAELLLEREFVL